MKKSRDFFCWTTRNNSSLTRNRPNVVAFVRDFFEIHFLLVAEVGGAIICRYSLPQVLGQYLQLQRRRVEALFSYSFTLEIFRISSIFLVKLPTE